MAATTWTARELPLADALDVVRAVGLRTTEIWADGAHLDPRVGAYEGPAVRRVLAGDLQVLSVHLPFHGVSEGSSADVRADDWVTLCAETLARGADLGARTAVVHPVIHEDPDEPDEYGLGRLTRALGRIVTAAQLRDMRVAVENMHTLRGPTLRSVAEITRMLGELGSSAGVCLDVGHAVFNGYTGSSLGDEVRAAGRHLLSTHVHDSDRVGADPHLIPGEGIADWPAFVDAIDVIGYSGPFVLEVNGGSNPRERLAEASARFGDMLRAEGHV